MSDAPIKAVVVGATGYVGGELLRLLAGHPHIDLLAAVSGSKQGERVGSVFAHLQAAYPATEFCSLTDLPALLNAGDRLAVFSAAPHGASAGVVAEIAALAADRNLDIHIVDSSADFRYADVNDFVAVYGGTHEAPELAAEFFCALPEHLSKPPVKHAGHPGCFATSMLLSIVPLYANQLVDQRIYISAVTGSTGSGRSPQPGTHHPVRHSNMYAYKPLAHRHVPEVEGLTHGATGLRPSVSFVPHSGSFARGIYATCQAQLVAAANREDVLQIFNAYYANSEFVVIVEGTPRLKDVVASNYAHIGIEVQDDTVVVMCAIDNLVKGAAGGALQWMNRLWDLPETSGLLSPAPAWT